MEMVAIEGSSNILQIGYDSAAQVLRVDFRNGDKWEYVNVASADHAALMAAESKGAYFGALRTVGRLGTGKKLGTSHFPPSNEGAKSEVYKPKSLILHSTACDDDCCRPLFNHAADGGALDGAHQWTCPECGTTFSAVDISDTVRHWKAEEAVLLIRPRR